MQYQGVPTGPGLFTERPDLGYGVFMAMFVTYLLMSFTILPMSRYMSRVTLVSTVYMSPIIIAFTLVGSFVPREYMFDMYLAFGFGVLGYIRVLGAIRFLSSFRFLDSSGTLRLLSIPRLF